MDNLSIIYLGGHTRYITPNSTMMIHQVSGSMKGTFNQLQDCYNGYKLSMDCMKKIYIDETNMNKRTLNNLLNRDVYLDANKCLEYGLAHHIQ
jgi:ATP-dependent protease ClpP protease subunit